MIYGLLLMLWLTPSQPVYATPFGARTVGQVNLALDLSESNNQDGHTRIAPGPIAPEEPNDAFLFLHLSNEDRRLEISGGWDPENCSTQQHGPGQHGSLGQ